MRRAETALQSDGVGDPAGGQSQTSLRTQTGGRVHALIVASLRSKEQPHCALESSAQGVVTH